MWWLFTCTSRVRLAVVFVALTAMAIAHSDGNAQSLETALMPGPVIRDHAKVEADCSKCHVRFDRAAQPGLCMDCHKPVGADVRGRKGYHGRIPEQECSSCHTEHKGRDAKIVLLDENRFDHRQTDFLLRGKHADVKCASCHLAGKKHRQTPSACAACHRRDDPHKGKLGDKCEQCHREANWKDTTFDHARTRFALKNRHAKPKCSACHTDKLFVGAPRECVACHRKDDAHKGRFGPRCADCHTDAGWKPAIFAHDRKTEFPLRGRHQEIKCESCHRAPTGARKLPTDCYGCHRADDPHKESLGARCERCHNERSWKTTSFNHDRDTRFALRDRHRSAKCQSCHKGPATPGKLPSACVACHRADDDHRGALGEQCEKCHAEKRWRETRFDHDRDTRFDLRGRHRRATCRSCHKAPGFREKLPTTCYACHRTDDRHKGELGSDCASCHDEKTWKDARFEHSRSRFPLEGRHAKVACKRCHVSTTFKEASVECVACHAKDDAHKERLGLRCGQCHHAQSWKEIGFNHDRDTRFRLEGAHTKVRCLSCHTSPVRGKLMLGTECMQCHRRDDVHFGSYGARCEECHVVSDWRQVDKTKVERFRSRKTQP